MRGLDAGADLEKLPGQVAAGAVAARAEIYPARLRFRRVYEIAQVLVRRIRIHHQHIRRVGHVRDGIEIPECVVLGALVVRHVDR